MNGQSVLAAALVRGLAEAGVAHACVSPGSRSTPLALALAEEARIRCWSHVDERAGGFFGLGIARATRRPVVLLCTSGTAAAEFYPAVIEARHARAPLVVLTADRPPELRDCGAGQSIDQIKLYGGSVKWFFEAAAPDANAPSVRFFRSLGARAAATAQAAPPGPVHLNLPFRDPLTPPPADLAQITAAAEGLDPRAHVSHANGALAPDDALIDELAAFVREEPEGIVVCGEPEGGADLADAAAAFARAAGYPVLADPLSGLRVGPRPRDLIIDAYDALLRVDRFAADHRPALVIRFGALPSSKGLRTFLEAPSGTRHILVDPWGDLRDPLHVATDVVHVDPALLCRALARALRGARTRASAWSRSWRDANARVRAVLQRRLDMIEELFEGRVARDVASALPSGATLFVGSSMPIRDLDTFFPGTDRAVTILANRGANGIDGVISTALGVAAVSPAPTVLLVGDLSFLHDLGGCLAARRYGIPLTIVLVNNDGGGIFHFLPQTAHARFEDLFATPHGLDFSHAARLFGLEYRSARNASELAEAMAESIKRGSVRLVEARTDPKRNVELHAEIRRTVEEALGAQ
jgi:2-succinyl-5-enolpyruvyl-6-hydroxy-3-cyclohexene-1-carboxylate synthase